MSQIFNFGVSRRLPATRHATLDTPMTARRGAERGARAVSLFIAGPKVREWGFHCPNGWVHWREFTAGDRGELVGRGCGEIDLSPLPV